MIGMEIAHILVAGTAHMEPDGRLFVINGGLEGLNIVRAGQAAPLQIHLVGKILFDPAECGIEHEIVIDLLGPDRVVLDTAPLNRITPVLPIPPMRKGSTAFLLQYVGLPIRVAGLHSFRVSVNERVLTELDLNVTIAPPAEGV